MLCFACLLARNIITATDGQHQHLANSPPSGDRRISTNIDDVDRLSAATK
jgi:hypothetical protein